MGQIFIKFVNFLKRKFFHLILVLTSMILKTIVKIKIMVQKIERKYLLSWATIDFSKFFWKKTMKGCRWRKEKICWPVFHHFEISMDQTIMMIINSKYFLGSNILSPELHFQLLFSFFLFSDTFFTTIFLSLSLSQHLELPLGCESHWKQNKFFIIFFYF